LAEKIQICLDVADAIVKKRNAGQGIMSDCFERIREGL
jgi:hypothetical protein